MKKKAAFILLILLPLAGLSAQEATRFSGDTLLINTTTLAPDVKGYNGHTPVEIAIVNRKVVSVTALPNRETARFFRLAKRILPEWEGLTVEKGLRFTPDAVSGASISSDALTANVHAGLEEAVRILPPAKKPFPWLPVGIGVGVLAIAVVVVLIIRRIHAIKNA